MLNVAEMLEIEMEPPRRAQRQSHRMNIPGEPKIYFKVYSIGILDQVISDLDRRFSKDQKIVAKLLCLSPEVFMEKTVPEIEEDLEDIMTNFQKVQFYLILNNKIKASTQYF